MSDEIGGGATASDFFRAADWDDRIVLFCGHEKDKRETSFGEATVAVCELVIIMDAPEGPEVYYDNAVFGKALAPTIYRADTPVVVGRLVEGEAKKGQSAPRLLEDLDKAELKAVRKWFKKYVTKDSRGTYVYVTESDDAPF